MLLYNAYPSVKLKLHHLVGGNSKEHLQEESKEQLQEETSKHLQEKEYAAEVDEALRATEDAWKGLDVEIELTVETAHPALEVCKIRTMDNTIWRSRSVHTHTHTHTHTHIHTHTHTHTHTPWGPFESAHPCLRKYQYQPTEMAR